MSTNKTNCGHGVSRSGGYYAGSCKRPAGHEGPHRLRPTALDLAVGRAVVAAFAAVWADRAEAESAS